MTETNAGRHIGAVVILLRNGLFGVEVSGTIYETDLPDHIKELIKRNNKIYRKGTRFRYPVAVDVFLEYDGMDLHIPPGDNIVLYTGLPWKRTITKSGLKYVFEGQVHPFSRPRSWLRSKSNYPHGHIEITGR